MKSSKIGIRSTSLVFGEFRLEGSGVNDLAAFLPMSTTKW